MYNEIHTVCHKYYHIGLILGITPNNLDIIKVESDGNDSVALSKVLNEFLRRSDPKPTWKMLTDALASRTVGYGYLAATIHQKLATS